MCQESILQWSKRYHKARRQTKSHTGSSTTTTDDEEDAPFSLVMVSIGLPQKAASLIDHLELVQYGTDTLLYVDPENAIYDALELNRGIQRTFFNLATPLAFLSRLQSENGLGDLGSVLSRWSQGT